MASLVEHPDIPNVAAKGIQLLHPRSNTSLRNSSGASVQWPVYPQNLPTPDAPGVDLPESHICTSWLVPCLPSPTSDKLTPFQVSPMCQYSAQDGALTDWHLTHLGGILQRGPGLTLIEATAVVPEGRITPQDSGLWSDDQIAPLKRIVEFAHSQNQKIGIQLAHAGRKASTVAPWLSLSALATEAVGGWPDQVYAPSLIPFNDSMATPHGMTLDDIAAFKTSWVASVKRAVSAGVDVIEIHAAHGYLFSSFHSPASNHRTDAYGGSFENRTRLTREIVQLTRETMLDSMPLFLRISATDWLENEASIPESWTVDSTVQFAPILADLDVDLLDISSGGNHALQKIKGGPGYQAPFSKAVKAAVGDKMAVSTVGTITEGKMANTFLEEGLDVVMVGRMFQKNPGAGLGVGGGAGGADSAGESDPVGIQGERRESEGVVEG